MENDQQINLDILRITNAIHKNFPELSKYISEMPVKISYKVDNEINTINLMDYYNSLNELMAGYAISHKKEKINSI